MRENKSQYADGNITEDEISDPEELAALANDVAAAFAKKQRYATLVAAARFAN